MIAALLALAALATEPESTEPEPSEPKLQLTFGGQTNPAGVAVLGSYLAPVGPTHMGPHAAVYFYWYELDLHVQQIIYGGFIVLNGWAGVEPGWFIPVEEAESKRRAWGGLRPLARARLELNLRNDSLWLYSRSTGLFRHRAFREYDPFKDVIFEQQEWSIEQSAALMGCPITRGKRKFWFYAEITLEAERTIGWINRMPRAGLIVENLTPTVSINLDVSYSLMDTKLGGPGALLAVWWNPKLKRD